jgi:methyl-accepting chemotaxis protein
MFFHGFSKFVAVGQIAAMLIFTLAGISLLAATALAFAGVLPWLDISASFGGAPIAWAGPAAQIALTVLFLLLAVYVPTSRQVLMLEATHREFALSMDDITSAYQAVHLADRKQAFSMQREYDAVRERYEYLKKHPDLPEIDAGLLTIAAQMSQQSRELAKNFSEENVERARESLKQRRRDAEELQERIQTANAASRELRREIEDVEYEEGSARSQLMLLREELAELEARIAGTGARTGRHLRPVSDVS